MKWQEIRSHYPQQWLLIEAIQARSEGNQRILDEISVIKTFLDSRTAMQSYTKLQHESPQRELYVVHTKREKLDITERRWLGIRGVQ